jgi:hypothetical protein
MPASTIRITGAFASRAHALNAVAFLGTADIMAETLVRTVVDERGNEQLTMLDVDVSADLESRVMTVIRGAHGVPISEPAIHPLSIAV